MKIHVILDPSIVAREEDSALTLEQIEVLGFETTATNLLKDFGIVEGEVGEERLEEIRGVEGVSAVEEVGTKHAIG